MADSTIERAAVLMFHGLTLDDTNKNVPARERKYWINARRFSRQLREIFDAGYGIRSLQAFWNGTDNAASAAPPAVITFDDGWASDYEIAFPRLLDAGATANFFLNTHYVGTPGYLTWSQVREMQRQGMTFGSHGHDHLYMTTLSPATLASQLRQSKQILEDELGCAAKFFSPPYGDCSKQVLEESRKAGYAAVCTSRSFRAQPGRATVNRVAVYADTGPETIRRMITGSPLFYAGRLAKAALLHFPKQIILAKEYAA